MPIEAKTLSRTQKTIIHMVAWARRRLGLRRGGFFLQRLYPDELRETSPITCTIRYHQRFKLQVNTRSWLEWKLFADGYYEPNVIMLLKRYIHAGDHVVDIGANIGIHTLIMSELVQQGRVHAFEPMPSVREKLQKNLAQNAIQNVTIYADALGHETGHATLYFDADSTNEGLATLYDQHDKQNKITVNVRRLDDVLGDSVDVRLIKIDVQGGEFPSIMGAEKIIARCKPIVIFEYDDSWQVTQYRFDDVLGFFQRFGYTLYGVRDNGDIVPVNAPHADITEYLASVEKA